MRDDDPQAAAGSVRAGRRPTRARRGVLRLTALAATVGVVAALVGIALLGRTVHTPLQDCGTVYGFLRQGRVDVFGDPANPPAGVSQAEVEATNARPCRPRVARAARVPGLLIALGTVGALAAATTEVVARFGARRRRFAVPAPSG